MLEVFAILSRFRLSFADHLSTEKGSTAAEYGLVLGFIALALVAGVTAVGVNLNDFIAEQAATIAGW